MQADLPLAELERYRPPLDTIVAPGFDAFWADTLAAAEAKARPLSREPVDTGLVQILSEDLTFSGFGGQPVRAWLNRPAGFDGPLPAVVQFLGYGGGRGQPEEHLVWASAGYAHVVMDSRGQGSGWSGGRGSTGATGDAVGNSTSDPTSDGGQGDRGGEGIASGPQFPGMLTRGIANPESYYYRRLFTDATRLVREVKRLDGIDAGRVAVVGASQGGASALAAAALEPVAAALVDTPFLCHVAQAILMVDTEPYFEIVRYLRAHRDAADAVTRTLSHVDGVGFAARARAPALFSIALMDRVIPPRTAFAAFNHYAGDKELVVYPYADHEGGEIDQLKRQIEFLRRRFSG